MNLTRLPDPPSISLLNTNNPMAFAQACIDWMQATKSAIEGDSTANTALLAPVANTGFQTQAGTLTTPPYSSAQDPTTGIYQPAIGQIAVAVEGVQELLLDSTGNITVATVTATTGNITTVNSTTGNITTVNATTVVATTVDASNVTAPTGDLTLASTSGAVRAPTIAETDNSTAVATTAWVTAAPPVIDNIGRNKIHNPFFNINQRGTGPFTSNGVYTTDRWVMAFTGDTMSISTATLNDTDRSQIGDESALFAIQNTFTGVNSAANFDVLIQRIENVHRLSNQTVTVSFWAKAASGTPKVGVSMDQSFGTGGSPSTAVQGAGTAFTLSTTWTRYSGQFTLASVSGKTLGTGGNDFTGLNFWFSSGSTNATRAGSIGVQTAIIAIWGVQCEVGSVATALEKLDPRYDFTNCQRFYQASGTGSLLYFGTATGVITLATTMLLPVPLRAAPSLTNYAFTTTTNTTSQAIAILGNTTLELSAASAGTGPFGLAAAWNTTADL